MMRSASPLLLAAFAVAVRVLAGCASTADYPSLAPRPIEKVALTGEPEAVSARSPDAGPLSTEARAAVDAAVKSDQDFRAELAHAETAVAAAQGAATGSEAWVAAQEALSRAESARGGTTAALTTLDAMRLAADSAPAALLDALTRVSALDRSQTDALAALTRRLPEPE